MTNGFLVFVFFSAAIADFYSMSYLWFSALSVLTSFTVGCIMSLILGEFIFGWLDPHIIYFLLRYRPPKRPIKSSLCYGTINAKKIRFNSLPDSRLRVDIQ